MAGLADIARERTDLSEPAISHLHALVAEWTLLADLGFADLVLWLPTWNTGGFVAAAQVRPNTGPTRVPDDIVGSFLPRGRSAILDRAASTRLPVLDRRPERPHVPVADEAHPILFADELIAVLQRYPGAEARADGALERTYLATFDALAEMVGRGAFPSGQPAAITDRPPRVGDGCFRVDAAGIVRYASPNAQSACHRLGVTGEITGSDLGETLARLLQKSGAHNDVLIDIARGRTAGASEVEHRNAVVTLRGIPLEVSGQPDGAIVLLRDVSELRRRDKALLTKDATIREIHHRVKNNLQTVASMLRLQARRSSSDEVRGELEEAVRRINAIAIVHDSLAHEPGAEVDFDEVIDRIIAMSRELLPERGSLSRQGSVGAMASERATPLAMAVAELVGNAVEHGLTGRPTPGTVLVTASKGDRIVIHVDDDGPGAANAPAGLGLSIVDSLVRGELRGLLTVTAGPQGGTRATIDIPR